MFLIFRYGSTVFNTKELLEALCFQEETSLDVQFLHAAFKDKHTTLYFLKDSVPWNFSRIGHHECISLETLTVCDVVFSLSSLSQTSKYMNALLICESWNLLAKTTYEEITSSEPRGHSFAEPGSYQETRWKMVKSCFVGEQPFFPSHRNVILPFGVTKCCKALLVKPVLVSHVIRVFFLSWEAGSPPLPIGHASFDVACWAAGALFLFYFLSALYILNITV